LRRNYTLAGLFLAGLVFAAVVAVGALTAGSPATPSAAGSGTPAADASLPADHPPVGQGDTVGGATQDGAPDYGAMIDALEKKHATNPDDLQTTMALADAYLMNEQPDKAVALYTEVLDRRPADERARAQLAMAWHAKGDDRKARAILDELLATRPQSQLGHYNLAILYFSQNRPALAKQEWKTAAAVDPESRLGVSAQSFVDLMEDQAGSPGAGQ